MARSVAGFTLTGDNQHLVMCVQITDRLDNVTGYTEHDQVLPHDLGDGNGSINYQPEAGFMRSAIEARSGGRVGSADLIGMIDSQGITEDAIFGQLYDSALIKFFLLDWTDPAAGRIHIEIGDLEETHVSEDKLTVTMKSLLDRYNTTKIGDYYEAECVHVMGSLPTDIPPPFGKIGCQIQLNPDAWSAGLDVEARPLTNGKAGTDTNTVRPIAQNGRFFEAQNVGTTGGGEPSWNTTLDAVTGDNGINWVAKRALRHTYELASWTSQSIINLVDDTDLPATWWQRAQVLGVAGRNAGLTRHVKLINTESPNELAISLWKPFPLAFEIGSPNDSFALIKGCDKLLPTCVNDLRNLDNNGAFASWAPNTDEVFKIPTQPE